MSNENLRTIINGVPVEQSKQAKDLTDFLGAAMKGGMQPEDAGKILTIASQDGIGYESLDADLLGAAGKALTPKTS